MIGTFVITLGIGQGAALAQDGHTHSAATQLQAQTADTQAATNAFVNAVRNATERFRNSGEAIAEQYLPLFGCVSGSSEGAMGVHFVNGNFLDGHLEVGQPEILLYEPLPNGGFQLTGVDYLVDQATWDAANTDPVTGQVNPPQLMGQLFHLFDAPNRFGLKAFYTLHVWAWKDNPQGTFANWNPNVSCDAYNPQS